MCLDLLRQARSSLLWCVPDAQAPPPSPLPLHPPPPAPPCGHIHESVSINHNFRRGESNDRRPLTSLTPYRRARLTHLITQKHTQLLSTQSVLGCDTFPLSMFLLLFFSSFFICLFFVLFCFLIFVLTFENIYRQ